MPSINKIRYEGTDYDILKEELEAKANIDGSYDTMTVGNAEQLVSSVGITDKVPYNFRTAGGSVDIGDRLMEKVVGGTIAWNQICKALASGNWAVIGTGASISFADGVASFTAVTKYDRFLFTPTSVVDGHKYLLETDLKGYSGLITFQFGIGTQTTIANQGCLISMQPTDEDWHHYAAIKSFTKGTDDKVIFQDNTGSGTTQIKNAVIFDLTQMFGSAIADYIYSLEQSTAGAGVAWFRKLFPKPYYAYNAGGLMSVQAAAHKTVGFNAWDEDWELGYILQGANAPSNSNIRSKNYIPVVPNAVYYIESPSDVYCAYYDAEKNYLGALDANGYGHTFADGSSTGKLRTMKSNCCYMRFYLGISTYNHDICINLSWDGERDGEYEPYVEHVYPLDDDLTLRGIPKLDASNQLYYDGDVYESDGTVTRRYAIATFDGSNDETWAGTSSSGWYVTLNNLKKLSNYKGVILCDLYETNAHNKSLADNYVSGYYDSNNQYPTQNWLYYTNSTLSTKNDLLNYLSEHPFTVVYELATPTTETADAYQNPQIVDDFGTEEYTDAGVIAETRDVAVPVGHESIYQPNLRAKLEMSPNSPDGDGDYIVRQTNGLNEYVPYQAELPTLPSENGTYALKVTISGSSITLSWVAEE